MVYPLDLTLMVSHLPDQEDHSYRPELVVAISCLGWVLLLLLHLRQELDHQNDREVGMSPLSESEEENHPLIVRGGTNPPTRGGMKVREEAQGGTSHLLLLQL